MQFDRIDDEAAVRTGLLARSQVERSFVQGADEGGAAHQAVSQRPLSVRTFRLGGVNAAMLSMEHGDACIANEEISPFPERDLVDRADIITVSHDHTSTCAGTSEANWLAVFGFSASFHGS